jgi:hypothetical protein
LLLHHEKLCKFNYRFFFFHHSTLFKISYRVLPCNKRLQALPTTRLKKSPRSNALAYFAIVSDGKKFYKIDTSHQHYKLFFFVADFGSK